jgi:hypothetical protein
VLLNIALFVLSAIGLFTAWKTFVSRGHILGLW